MMPTFGSLFAGIGGFDDGLCRAGWRCAFQVEIDPFCQRVLAARFPSTPRHGDITTFAPERGDSVHGERGGVLRDEGSRVPDGDGAGAGHDRRLRDLAGRYGDLDLLTAGFPCQDLSVAGKRAGLRGTRSTLFYEIVRVAKILTPTWGLFENVPGLLSSHSGRDFWLVLQGLRECWPAVGWRVLDSQHFGVAQRRRRVFLVCGPTEASVAEILALAEGGARDSPTGREAWAGVATGPVFSTLNSGGNTGGFRTEPGEHIVNQVAFRKAQKAHDPEDGERWEEDDLTDTLGVHGTTSAAEMIHAASAVRRLTPVECERLQGFDVGWTCLCQPIEAYAAPDDAALRCVCPDSARYRTLGNAVTVNVIEELGHRLLRVSA
jgi:DNA (cytosine-5)-methyltransferase 1